MVIIGQHEDPCGDGNVLYLDCISVNILVVILYCNFARHHHWGDWVKNIQNLCIISYNSM